MPSRKTLLTDFANGLVHRFVSRNSDIGGYWAVGVLSRRAHESGRDGVEVDLLSQDDECDGGSATWLRARMAATETPTHWLTSAVLHVDFTPYEADPSEKMWPVWIDRPAGEPMFRAVVTAILTDDLGRQRTASTHTWCWDHNPIRENGPARREWLKNVGFDY